MKRSRAQVSIELIVILAVILTIFGIVLVTSNQILSVGQSKSYNDQTRIALDIIAEETERIYFQGIGAKSTVTIRLPPTLNSSTVSAYDVSFYINVQGGNLQEIYRRFPANVTGTLPSTPGVHVVTIDHRDAGVVLS